MKRATRPLPRQQESRAPCCRDLRRECRESPLSSMPSAHLQVSAARAVGSARITRTFFLVPTKPSHRRRDRPRCAGCGVESASNRLLRGGVQRGRNRRRVPVPRAWRTSRRSSSAAARRSYSTAILRTTRPRTLRRRQFNQTASSSKPASNAGSLTTRRASKLHHRTVRA